MKGKCVSWDLCMPFPNVYILQAQYFFGLSSIKYDFNTKFYYYRSELADIFLLPNFPKLSTPKLNHINFVLCETTLVYYNTKSRK